MKKLKLILSAIIALLLVSCHSYDNYPDGYKVGNGIQQNVISNGNQMLDSNGKPINGHNGNILQVGNAFYWYGEDWSDGYNSGVACYRSSDLIKWVYAGKIFDEKTVNHPKVMYNTKDRRFVLWAQDAATSSAVVAWSYRPADKFNLYKTFRPFDADDCCVYDDGTLNFADKSAPKGFMVGDSNVFIDDDGTGYFISNFADNQFTNIYKLTDDYLDIDVTVYPTNYLVSEYIAKHCSYDKIKDEFGDVDTMGYTDYQNYLTTIYNREYNAQKFLEEKSRRLPALFKKGNVYYLLTAGISGEAITPVTYQTSTSIQGEWSARKVFSDTPDGTSITGYATKSDRSLPVYVFKLQSTDKSKSTYMYMGERRLNAYNPSLNQNVWMKIEFDETALTNKIYSAFSDGLCINAEKGTIGYPQYYYVKNAAAQYMVMPGYSDNTAVSPSAVAGQTACWTTTAPTGDNSSTIWRDQYLYQWRLIPLNGGYQIINRWSGLALEAGAKTGNVALSLTEPNVKNPNQVWSLEEIFADDYKIKNSETDYCVSTGIFTQKTAVETINGKNALFQTGYGECEGSVAIINKRYETEADRYRFEEQIVSVQKKQSWFFNPVRTADDEL